MKKAILHIKWYLKGWIFSFKRFRKEYVQFNLSHIQLAWLYFQTKVHPQKRKVETQFFQHKLTTFNNYFWLLHSIDEIFVEEVYNCVFESDYPKIIDCGANIGISILYFKQIAPAANIIAFEPDSHLCSIIEANVKSFGLQGVQVVNKGVWNENAFLEFEAEGTLGGEFQLGAETVSTKHKQVEVVRLRDLLHEEIDFLKIDIEGAEYEVLKDCREKISNVRNVFIEFHGEADQPQKLHEMLLWMSEAGFRYNIKDAWNNQPHPFLKRKSKGRDMQLNLFFFK